MSYHKQRRGKEEHEKALKEYIENCTNKILDLSGKSPDAIEAYFAIDGSIKLRAVEVLPLRWNEKTKSWKKTWTYNAKISIYDMFDDVRIIGYNLEYTKK
jgi:hypothetical protein